MAKDTVWECLHLGILFSEIQTTLQSSPDDSSTGPHSSINCIRSTTDKACLAAAQEGTDLSYFLRTRHSTHRRALSHNLQLFLMDSLQLCLGSANIRESSLVQAYNWCFCIAWTYTAITLNRLRVCAPFKSRCARKTISPFTTQPVWQFLVDYTYAFTLIPSLPWSQAAAFVKPITACFEVV